MTVHHLHAFFNGTIEFQFGIIPQDKSRHGIRKRLDDARHDKQHGPKKRIDTGEYHRPGHTGVLTSSLRHPKIFVKEFSDFLMSCHQHCLGVNLLV